MTWIFSGCQDQIKDESRPAVLFNDGWEFVIAADSSGIFENPGNYKWQEVTLPHTPVIEPLIVNNQWQGTCWYRKSFRLPRNSDGKKFFLRL